MVQERGVVLTLIKKDEIVEYFKIRESEVE